jgi:Cyclic-phosphate processing Receiver domain
VRVWLDDTRDAPPGWMRARTPEEVVALLGGGKVEELSLDHDLGPDPSGRERTGYEVLVWLEEEVAAGRWVAALPRIAVHSGNPVGRARMERALEAIRRLHGEARR